MPSCFSVDDLEVVAQATSVQALEELDVEAHVLATGLVLADVARDEVIKRRRDRFCDAAIMALTVLDDLPTVRQVLAAGANGYVLKTADMTDLLAGIRAVARGELYLHPSIGIAFVSRLPEELADSAIGGLTPKETEVLRLLALGHTNAAIAHLLGLSLRTIETHRAHIHQKLDRRAFDIGRGGSAARSVGSEQPRAFRAFAARRRCPLKSVRSA
jgi:two-component system response regulator NreC